MTDPWLVREKANNLESSQNFPSNPISNESTAANFESKTSLAFEDNFLPSHNITNTTNFANFDRTPLPDSENYLQSLEKKLKKIKQNPKIVEALSEKRAECLRNLLDDNLFINKDESLELDAPISSGDSTVQEIYRYIQPVQPLSVGETVHIVKYDQLEPEPEDVGHEEQQQQQQQQGQEDSTSESTSR